MCTKLAYVMVFLVVLPLAGCGTSDTEVLAKEPAQTLLSMVSQEGKSSETGQENPQAILLESDVASSEDRFEGGIENSELTACNVTVVYCRDPRYSPRHPSFCQNGCSSLATALKRAISICKDICGNIDCDPQWYLGRC